MKKFLALMFVCAGLTAMAGAPQINKANFTKANTQKVMTSKAAISDMAVTPGQGVLTPREFFKQHNVTPADNRLMKKAPRRLTDEDVAATPYLDFRYVYKVASDGTFEWHDYHFRSGGVYWQIANEQLYCAGIYWNEYTSGTYYLPVTIDYTTNLVTIPSGILLDDDTTQGNVVNNIRTDTINYSILADGNWYTGASEEFTDVPGTIYPDGTIIMNDSLPYVFAGYQVVQKVKRSGNAWSGYTWTVQSSDTTFFEEYYFNTQFIVPNATHDYDMLDENGATTHNTKNAYMYQYDDTTAAVFNMWGLGMPGVEMNIYADGTMKFPLDYPVAEMGIGEKKYYENYYGPSYNWDNCRWYWPIGLQWDEETQKYVELEDTVLNGTVEPTAIKWGATEYYVPGIVRVADGAQMSLSSYPFLNNVLTFTDGSEFVFGTPYMRGDVNNDGNVNISDVTDLINHMLTEDYDDSDTFNGENADCDLSGDYGIGDVTTLINYLLTEAWPAE